MPTDEDWDTAIQRFRVFRYMEKSAARRRAQRLPDLLEEQAIELYRTAARLEETRELAANIQKYTAAPMRALLRKHGYHEEIAERFISISFLFDLPIKLDAKPKALRRHAETIQRAAEFARHVFQLYLNSIEMLRERTNIRRGDYPSVAGWWLISATDQWGVTLRKIAEQLLDRGVPPDTGKGEETSDEPPTRAQLVAQWIEMLKKIRRRARRRGSGRWD